MEVDSEGIHIDNDEEDLLEDSEEVLMVDTHSSSLCEPPVGTISWDAYFEKSEVLDTIKIFVDLLIKKDEKIESM